MRNYLCKESELPSTNSAANFHENQFSTYIDISRERALTLKFTCNFNGSGLRSTDTQAYNERKSNWQDALVSNSEPMLLSYIHGKIHGAECRDISGTFLRPTSGKFETELAERASHDRETGLEITREVHVFLVFIKIAFNKSLLLYGF